MILRSLTRNFLDFLVDIDNRDECPAFLGLTEIYSQTSASCNRGKPRRYVFQVNDQLWGRERAEREKQIEMFVWSVTKTEKKTVLKVGPEFMHSNTCYQKIVPLERCTASTWGVQRWLWW